MLTSCTAASLQFNFTAGSSAGKSGTISLTRVGPTPPGCTDATPQAPIDPPMCYYPPCYDMPGTN